MNFYNWKPVDENGKRLFAVAKGPCQQACEEAESQNLTSEISICEPQRSITPEDIGARLSIDEFEV